MSSRLAAAVCDRRRAWMICWIATARRTFVCFSSALRSPRSANTLPELRTTDSLFRPFAISCLVVLAGHSEPPRNKLDVGLRRLSALRRLLLKRMHYINRMLELYRVSRPVSIAAVVGNDFQHAGLRPSTALLSGACRQTARR